MKAMSTFITEFCEKKKQVCDESNNVDLVESGRSKKVTPI